MRLLQWLKTRGLCFWLNIAVFLMLGSLAVPVLRYKTIAELAASFSRHPQVLAILVVLAAAFCLAIVLGTREFHRAMFVGIAAGFVITEAGLAIAAGKPVYQTDINRRPSPYVMFTGQPGARTDRVAQRAGFENRDGHAEGEAVR